MDKVEMRIERGNAELLVRYELSNIHYDTKVYKKAFEFIFITIILGALWVWCSSSPESNVFVFLSEHQMVRNVLMFCSPIILYGIPRELNSSSNVLDIEPALIKTTKSL